MKIKKLTRNNYSSLFILLISNFFIFYNISPANAGTQNFFETIVRSLRNPFNPIKKKEPVLKDEFKALVDVSASKNEFKEAVIAKKIKKEPRMLPPLPKMEITGVVFHSEFPQVIINGNVLGVGDEVDGFKIKKIKENAVIFSFKKYLYHKKC